MRGSAALATPDLDEAQIVELLRSEAEAQKALFVAPAIHNDQIARKLDVFSSVVAEQVSSGITTDNCLLIALAAIRQDLTNLDIGF